MNDKFLFEEYFKEKQKHKLVDNISNEDKRIMTSVIMILSFSEHEDEETHNDNYRHILTLLRHSQAANSILPELRQAFDTTKTKAIAEIEAEREVLFEKMLNDKLAQYKHLTTNHPVDKRHVIEQLRQSCFNDKKNVELVLRYNTLEQIVKNINFPYIELTANLLRTKVGDSEENVLMGLASIIENPRRLSFHNAELEPEWKTFPLKWFSDKITLPELRHLFKLHKQGKSLDSYIEKYVADHIKEIVSKFDNHFHPEFAKRANVLHNCIHSFENELYASSLCTALPLIEGSIWIFADYYNAVEKNLFTEINGDRHLILTNGNNTKDYTIGDLLKRSNLKDFFDSKFINYYCDELYNERNPILHGNEVDNFTRLNCAKKIMTLDYLTDVMNAFVKREYIKNMGELLGERITEKMLNKQPLDDADRKEMMDKVSRKKAEAGGRSTL